MPPTPAPSYLVIRDPAGDRRVQPLVEERRVTIGRAPTNQIVIADERASRQHAEVFPTVQGWAIRDLDSRNGTLLDGEPVLGDRTLGPGQVISIGLAEILFGSGEPPVLADETGGTGAAQTGDMPADLREWHASITHRQARGRLLDSIRESADREPRVGRAAAELCRLAFTLGQAADMASAGARALEAAAQAVGAARGAVLVPMPAPATPPRDPARTPLEAVATMPTGQPAVTVPADVVAAVLHGDEAVLATVTGETGRVSTLSAPVRIAGIPRGLVYLEITPPGGPPTVDDLEFVMAVCDALGLAVDNITARESLSTRLAGTVDENTRLRQRLGEDSRIVGGSSALAGILDQVARVAGTHATVLVRGESGTGKELVARAIHEASDRRGGPFICLNCAALSETLLESELFGHEKGAFTGATERKIGKFEAANGGTLMLDEIGEMSPEIQAKFLRVLEGHPFERVGGSVRVQADVRVVAATNRNLEDAVASGGFRRDLYFRLKVVEILVPPLRRRAEDIPVLATHFLERFAAETRRRIRGFTPEALAALESHRWPGNIRELRNCIERAVVLAAGDMIDLPDLALSPLTSTGDSARAASGPRGRFVPRSIADVEREHVMATLEAVGGNKTKAAALLGIERSTLDRKLARWAHT
jgi:transcriptional regulator with GAF, ATPase, and Fis domain/pSer/pThr/pTyr-binding forkhead associated (FHA) protein